MSKMSEIKYYSVDEVGRHHRVDDAWVIVDSKVFDITAFLDTHPGGMDILREHLGHDVSAVMRDEDSHQHTGPAFELLDDYYVGELADGKLHNGGQVNNGGPVNKKNWKEDDLVDWSKAMLPQIANIGEHYEEWVHSPVNRKLKLFNSEFVELLSKSPWWLIPLVWIPTIFYVCWLSLTAAPTYLPTLPTAPAPGLSDLILLPLGTLLWTFIEYSLHRFVFHIKVPCTGLASRVLLPFHFTIHGQHHKIPFDPLRLVFPPAPAAIIVLMLYVPLAHILPLDLNQSRLLLAGGLVGYVCYDMMHYYLHHGSPSAGGYLADLKSYHVAHHYVNPGLGYGISSKLWDVPFGTLLPASMFPDKKRKAN